MFVTNLPSRIVEAKYLEVVSSGSLTVGTEGLGTRMKIHGGNLVLSSCEQKDKYFGYLLHDGEVVEFSGCVDVCNTGTAESSYVSVITTDSI